MSGWIKIHRKILGWEWYDDINTCRLFFHLILKANHKSKKFKGMNLEPGTIITGRDVLANETKLSVQQLRTALNKLKSTNEITIKTTSKGTVITVVNYKKYQIATSEATNNQPTSNQQITTNKKERSKEDNILPISEEKKSKVDSFLDWFNSMALKHKGKEGRFKSLTQTDINNLKRLKESGYTLNDFENAYIAMINAKWVIENNMSTPAHFLRNDVFVRYLNTDQPKQQKSLDDKLYENVMKQVKGL